MALGCMIWGSLSRLVVLRGEEPIDVEHGRWLISSERSESRGTFCEVESACVPY